MAFTYAIALTGSIATGKSTAASFLSELGFDIIDADSIAHQILNEEQNTIIELFGKDIIKKGLVDRKALGAIVFSDEIKRKQLENLLHPLIYTRIESLSMRLDEKKKPYLVDIPLFFENNRYPIRKVLLVYTPSLLQLQRLVKRDALSTSEAQKRIDIQMAVEEKRKKADYVIDNSATLASLKRECLRVKNEIAGDFK